MIHKLSKFPIKYVSPLKRAFERNKCEGIFKQMPGDAENCILLIETYDETMLVLLAMLAGNIEIT